MKKTKFDIARTVTLCLGLVIFIIHVLNAMTFGRIIQYREVPFYSPRWPQGLDGYRIAFVTDTHNISNNRLQRVVDRLNDSEIDLLLLGGDFWAYYERSLGVLAGVNTADGIFGVEGNHDCHIRLFAEMERHGMTPLSNCGRRIHDGFWLAGVEDLWNRNPSIADATAGSCDDFILLLSHNPDVAMRQDTSGLDLIVSGHTHAGQVRFFGLWAPIFTFTNIITNYGHRFASGWSKSRDDVPVFISNGTGQGYFPRIFARPQVIIFTMYSQ